MISFLKKIIKPFYFRWKEKKEKSLFLNTLSRAREKGGPIKVVIGSSSIFDDGWIPSEAHFLDLLDEKTWLKYFKKGEVDCLVAEHVWEHLTEEEGIKAANTCHMFLKQGGTLRVAVPDGFHKDKSYIDYVKPGGYGAGAHDHKVLYNFKSFSTVFEKSGFKVNLLEYFDANNVFISNGWGNEKGVIRRTIKNDPRNKDGKPNYTSLLIDAIKV